MEWVDGQRKGKSARYKYGEFLYHEDGRYPGRRYTCISRRVGKGCPIKAFVEENNEVRIEGGKHRHPKPTNNEREQLTRELRAHALDYNQTPTQIARSILNNFPNGNKIMHLSAATTTIYRERNSHVPKLPPTLSGMPAILCNLPIARGSYLDHFVADDGSHGLVFGSRKLLQALQDADALHIDGTFASRPRSPNSRQLLILHTRIKNIGVATLFVICEKKTTSFYSAFWKYVLGQVPELRNTLKYVYSDYEQAILTATRENLPNVQIRGCWIHFIRACTRKWMEWRLPRTSEANLILARVWSSALVPPDRFEEAIKNITSRAKPLLEEHPNILLFLNYMKKYWEPLKEVVCIPDTVRTNNVAEAFNLHLITRLGGDRPAMYKFIDRIKLVIKECEVLYEDLMTNTTQFYTQTTTQIVRDEYIRYRQIMLAGGKYSMDSFLNDIFPPQERDEGMDIRLEMDCYEDDGETIEVSSTAMKNLLSPPHLPKPNETRDPVAQQQPQKIISLWKYGSVKKQKNGRKKITRPLQRQPLRRIQSSVIPGNYCETLQNNLESDTETDDGRGQRFQLPEEEMDDETARVQQRTPVSPYFQPTKITHQNQPSKLIRTYGRARGKNNVGCNNEKLHLIHQSLENEENMITAQKLTVAKNYYQSDGIIDDWQNHRRKPLEGQIYEKIAPQLQERPVDKLLKFARTYGPLRVNNIIDQNISKKNSLS